MNYSFLYRKKKVDQSTLEETKLARVLNTFDLTALGIGSTLGAGIYVLAGDVIKNVSGPSVILSFFIAAVASLLAGLCYAEFGARVPKTGSAYVYTYVTIGEFLAFVIGWNLILEYIIGTSSVARAFSTYFDSLVDNRIQKTFEKYMPMHISGLSPYPDFFAFAITLLITGLLTIGVKESSVMNNIFTGINLFILVFVFICGAIKANFNNWSLSPQNFPVNCTEANHTGWNDTSGTHKCGTGGFLPFGFMGMISGSAKCFYAFVGFDCIATTGEEVKNPQKAIPLSIMLALFVCCIAYCGVSAILSLMIPYYFIDQNAPMPEAFRYVNWDWARYIVAIGAICSLSTSLLGAMFPLPRVLYAISSDGLIFRFLSRIHPKLKTPVIGTILSGIFAGVMAMLFDLDQLVNMMSIGTLLAYSLVAISVLILRYEVQNDEDSAERTLLGGTGINQDLNPSLFSRLVYPYAQLPNEHTSRLTKITIGIITGVTVALCGLLVGAHEYLHKAYVFIPVALLASVLFLLTFFIWRQPQNRKSITFQMPFMPVLPVASVFINFYLMMVLSAPTWIRFGVWMAIGFIIYFAYGIRNSSENTSNRAANYRPLKNNLSSSTESINNLIDPKSDNE